MKAKHLTTANKYIEKQISSLRAEQAKLRDKADDLNQRADIIEQQIQAIYKAQETLVAVSPKPHLIDSKEFIS